jgi:hypothetical protein
LELVEIFVLQVKKKLMKQKSGVMRNMYQDEDFGSSGSSHSCDLLFPALIWDWRVSE